MKKKFIKGDTEIETNSKENKDTDILKITKSTKEKFKALAEGFHYNKIIAWAPTMLVGGMFIACFLYPGIDTNEVLKNWFILLVGPFMTLSGYCVILPQEYKYKRLYKQVCDGTIIRKQVKIIKFKRCRSRIKFSDYKKRSSMFGYRVIASDGEKKYKSLKISDEELGLDGISETGYLGLDFILELVNHKKKDSLEIYGKTYHLGDMLVVYIDSEKKWNYYLDV